MKCPDYRKKISSYLDGELDPCSEKKLYKHLSSCPHCARYLDEFRSLDKLLKSSMAFLNPPEDLAEGILKGISGLEACSEKNQQSAEPQQPVEEKRSFYKKLLSGITEGVKGAPKRAAVAAVLVLFITVGLWSNTAVGLGEGSLWKNLLVKSAAAYYKVLEIGNMLEEGDVLLSRVLGDNNGKESRKPTSPSGFVEIRENLFAHEDAKDSKPGVLEAETVFLTPLAVSESFNNVRPVWAGKNVIYYLSERGAPGGNGYVVWQTNIEGSKNSIVGKRELVLPLENKGGAAWSADKEKLAFVTNRNQYWEIWYSDLQGELMNLTAAVSHEEEVPQKGSLWGYNPTWSALGDLAFLTQRWGSTDIMVSNTEGEAWTVAKTENEESFPVWSPEGKRLAFFRSLKDQEGQRGGIFVADRKGEEVYQVTPLIKNAAMVPAWSPKGNYLAVNVDVDSGTSKESGLWCVDAGGKNWSRVSELGGGKVVSWSPDGTKIAFTGKNGRLYVFYREGGKDKGKVLPIIPDDRRGYVNYIEWSKDSRRILMEWVDTDTGKSGIWLATLPQE
ncbi:MAG: hypothetical protein GX088_07815 [Clostridia bacterium]|nr:hypothetical protein [Clostridia bacterium]